MLCWLASVEKCAQNAPFFVENILLKLRAFARRAEDFFCGAFGKRRLRCGKHLVLGWNTACITSKYVILKKGSNFRVASNNDS